MKQVEKEKIRITKYDEYISMREINFDDYLQFIKKNKFVIIENKKIELTGEKIIYKLEPENFQLETTTVWSFPNRGDWATHKGDYRGNWSPYIPRNLILKYTKEEDWVLDTMVGSGTTLIECKLLNRNAIGVDININAIMLTLDRLNFKSKNLFPQKNIEPIIKTFVGDARNLNLISNNSIDFILFHPPYFNIIKYSKSKIKDDLSSINNLEDYLKEMEKVIKECWRVLKENKHCAILIGDTRKHKHYIPISFYIMDLFLKNGFILKEDIIKIQWKMQSTREKWLGKKNDFYLIKHEHLFVFRKPDVNENLKKLKYSSKINLNNA